MEMDLDKAKELSNYARRGMHFEVQSLINEGVSINVKGELGITALMNAATLSHVEGVKLLINLGADIEVCSDRMGTALHLATFVGSMEVVQFLVDKGADLNAKNYDGETPLMVATRWFHTEIVELLINSGADIHCCDGIGNNLLHHASKGGLADILTYIFTNEVAGITALSPFNYLVEDTRFLKTIKLCVERGAYVQSADYNELLKDPMLKKAVLQDVKLCSQAAINKFNNRDLPLFYKRFAAAQKLPHIDKMKIRNGSGVALQVEQSVTHDVQAHGFCNLYEMIPSILSILCVKTLIEKSKPAFDEANLSGPKKCLKRLRNNAQEYPCKKA